MSPPHRFSTFLLLQGGQSIPSRTPKVSGFREFFLAGATEKIVPAYGFLPAEQTWLKGMLAGRPDGVNYLFAKKEEVKKQEMRPIISGWPTSACWR
jgi:hypothetical protein